MLKGLLIPESLPEFELYWIKLNEICAQRSQNLQ